MKLTATKRKILGKKVKTLRQQELLPAVVFGKELKESIPITLDKKEFERVYHEAGESTLIDVEITDDGRGQASQLHKVLVSEVDRDPVSDEILHANLHAVSLKEKITAKISIKIIGESSIVKSGEGLLLTILDEIEIECLPQDLPSAIEVDISGLTKIDQNITIKDIKIGPEKINLKHDPDEVVLKIEHAEMKEEEVKTEEKPIEEAVEITTEKKKEEGGEGEEGKEKVRSKKAVAREKS